MPPVRLISSGMMNNVAKCLLLLAALVACLPAQAEVRVMAKTLQKGLFNPPKCDGADECLCEADITYPVIEDMRDSEAQASLNASIRNAADQLKCQGLPAKKTSKGDSFSIKHSYEVTFQSAKILGLKFTDWAYEGGAHSNGSVEGQIIDLETGKVLAVDDIFGRTNIPAINKIIYDTLAPKAEGIFRDEVENRKESFIKDGKCQGCTLLAGKNGISVVFQSYEVAPFAEGNPEVVIPVRYVVYKPIVEALAVSK